MASKTKLTKTAIGALRPGFTWDSETRGLGVRMTPAGAKSWIFQYRAGKGRAAPTRRMTLGPCDSMTPDQARKKAERLRAGIHEGQDPAADQRRQRQAERVSDMLEIYIEDHVKVHNRARTVAEVERLCRASVPKWLRVKTVADVSRGDIRRLKRELQKTPYQANRVLAMLSKAFNVTGEHNPTRGVERFQEDKRERFLSPTEIARLSEALGTHGNRLAADAIRLLLLTGARAGEALSATWDQFDLEAGVWIKPSSHTKQKREHRVPLSAPARQLLAEMPRLDKTYVFPGQAKGSHLKSVKSSWAAICEAAGIEGVRLHDLRHTYASILASSGMSLQLIGRLLGHSTIVTTQRYSHLYDDPLREAVERVGKVVDSRQDAKVVVAKRL